MKPSTTGSGGVKAALGRNPNPEVDLNDAPEGPFAHSLGQSGDGGMKGSDAVSHKGGSFHFK